jgi:hypothetical protein
MPGEERERERECVCGHKESKELAAIAIALPSFRSCTSWRRLCTRFPRRFTPFIRSCLFCASSSQEAVSLNPGSEAFGDLSAQICSVLFSSFNKWFFGKCQ